MDEELRERLRQQNFRRQDSLAPKPVMRQRVQPAPAAPVPARETAVIAQTQKSSKLPIVIIGVIIGVLGLAGGGYGFLRHASVQKSQTPSAQISAAPSVSIPLYHPRNLPSGYTYNKDDKVIKKDVTYFSVAGPNKSVFYITQQPIPASFDFVAFNKKFLNPDTYNTAAGTVTAGPVGAAMLGSIRTNKNTWIIINSSAESTLSELEIVTRSFE